MRKLRILFLPSFFGMPSHFIPLVKLFQLLNPEAYESAFFLAKLSRAEFRSTAIANYIPRGEYYYCGEFYSHFNLPQIAFPRQFTVSSELRAYASFKPDVIVDDCNTITPLTQQIDPRRRITLLRTGAFGSNAPRLHGYRHTFESMIAGIRVPAGSGFTVPESIEEYFNADAYVIPGVPSLERPHATAEGQSRGFFSGPLILDEQEEAVFYSDGLLRFFSINADRPIAYVTFGSASTGDAHQLIAECFRYLLRNFSVITNVQLERIGGSDLIRAAGSRFFFSDALPMHYVTSRAALVVHVCSSGMYHYPLLHGKSAITIGTNTYDREHIARTLAARALSLHIPAPSEASDFVGLFRDAIDRVRASRFPFDVAIAGRLDTCRAEITSATKSFDISRVVDVALA